MRVHQNGSIDVLDDGLFRRVHEQRMAVLDRQVLHSTIAPDCVPKGDLALDASREGSSLRKTSRASFSGGFISVPDQRIRSSTLSFPS